MIDLFRPFVPEEAVEEVVRVLRSRFIGQGPKVDQFEKEFSALFNVSNVVSVSSGTAALETAVEILGLDRGDSVISTPLTCSASNLTLLRRGIKIIWADVLEGTLCIDPKDVVKKLTPEVKAVMQVHLGGIKAHVYDLALPVPVISDAAQALGIFSGDVSCFSFQAIKTISTPDGGMIVLNTPKEARDAKLLRWFGIDREKKIANNWQAYKERKMTFDIELPGTKRHMNDVSAAMGLVGLRYYDRIMNHRKKIFNIYKERLKNFDGVKIVDGDSNVYWLATILVERRDDFARMMFEGDVDVNTVHVRNDLYKIFGGNRTDLPVLNALEEKYISIPIGMHVSEDDAKYITDLILGGW
jgi:dTDP-4-amino-4,6-dideoxygalactose transaminase